jgi:hypothetical protein
MIYLLKSLVSLLKVIKFALSMFALALNTAPIFITASTGAVHHFYHSSFGGNQ